MFVRGCDGPFGVCSTALQLAGVTFSGWNDEPCVRVLSMSSDMSSRQAGSVPREAPW